MPIYDYSCRTCGHRFEALVLRNREPDRCEACGGADLERLLSLPNVKSEATQSLARRAAQRRDAAQATERVQEQIRYERSHDD
jgi:putative FmdB family regulatory protein